MAEDRTDRRYGRAEIEGILGRALVRRDPTRMPDEALEPHRARTALTRVARANGVAEADVLAAFEADAEEYGLARDLTDLQARLGDTFEIGRVGLDEFG